MVYTVNGVNYTRRTKILVTGAGSGAQTDYQIKLAAIWAAAMQADFDDVRFTKADMQTLIDAWLESKVNSTSANIWVEFPNTPADGVEKNKAYMYFGNAGSASGWDIGATFVFGDDFPGSSLDTSKWDKSAAVTATVTGGTCTLSGSLTTWGGISSKGTYPANREVAMYMRASSASIVADCGFINPIGAISTTDDLVAFELYQGTNYYFSNNGSAPYDYTTEAWTQTNWDIYQARMKSGRAAEHLINSSSKNTENTDIPTQDCYVSLYRRDYNIEIDYVYVRKYTANPPTAAFGTEEHQRRTPMMM